MFYQQNPINGTIQQQNQIQDYNMNSGPGLYPSNREYGQFNTGGNLHDTFKTDRYNNIYGGHTTVDLGNNQQIHLGW